MEPVLMGSEEDEEENSEIDDLNLPESLKYPLFDTTEDGRPIIQVGFWGPKREEESYFSSSVTAWCTRVKANNGDAYPSFSHCEIRFGNRFVCSILESVKVPDPRRMNQFIDVPGTVHCRQRELDRRDYYFIEFPVTHNQHSRMFNQAMKYAKEKRPFNRVGMLLNFVFPFKWFPIDARGDAFFCSELVVDLLHHAGILMDVTAYTTSPNSLWVELLHVKGVCTSINRNSQMEEKLGNLVMPEDFLSISYKNDGAPRLKPKK